MIKEIFKALKKGKRVTYEGNPLSYEGKTLILQTKDSCVINPQLDFYKIVIEEDRNIHLQQYERYVTRKGKIAFALGKEKDGRWNVIVSPNYYPTYYDGFGRSLRKGNSKDYDIVRKL